MGFTCGLVGLPNAGKSTLFGALTRTKAQAGNYAFTTIEKFVYTLLQLPYNPKIDPNIYLHANLIEFSIGS